MNVFINYKCHISIELAFLKEIMLIRQVHEKSVIFGTICIFWTKFLSFNQMCAMGVMMNLNDIAILNIHGVDYRCIINRISKSEAANRWVKKL